MVNRAAVRNSAQQAKDKKNQRGHRMLFRQVSFWEEAESKDDEKSSRSQKGRGSEPKKDFKLVPRLVTLLTAKKLMLDSLHLHEWKGSGKGAHLKIKHICPRMEFGDDNCDICSTESKYACWPDQYMLAIGYVHDFVGKTYRGRDKNGDIKRFPIDPRRVILFPEKADGVWDKITELDEAGVLTKTVLKLSQTKGPGTFKLEEASERLISKLANGGRVPKEIRIDVRENWNADFTWAHMLNSNTGARFEHWGVEEPVFEDKGDETAEQSYPEEEDEDDEYNAGADEDDDDDEKGRRRSKSKSASSSKPTSKSKPKRKPADEDDDDLEDEDEEDEPKSRKKTSSSSSKAKPKRKPPADEDDDDDLEEDEEEEKPRKKPASAKSKPAKSKPAKKKVDEDDDDEDEPHWSDEDEDEEEEETKPRKKTPSKPAAKSKSKPATKSKKPSKKDEDDDDLDEEDDIEDDFDDDYEDEEEDDDDE